MTTSSRIRRLHRCSTSRPTIPAIPRSGSRSSGSAATSVISALGAGPLPTDRRHQFRCIRHSDGEIPETPRGAAFQTVDGFRSRTPWLVSFDLHGDYRIRTGGHRGLLLTADVFNLFNRRAPQDYDNYTEASFAVPNPGFGRVLQYQNPISARVGLRFVF
jgi:outer membrane receptor protein involved in Fe transport